MRIGTAATPGSTIRNIAAALPIPTPRQRTSTAVRLAGIPRPLDRQVHVRNKALLTGSNPARITEAPVKPTGQLRATLLDRAMQARIVAATETTLATGKFRVTTHRRVRAPSGARPADPVRKPAVLAVHPAGVECHTGTAAAVGN